MVEKFYAGVGCFEVLAELSNFADGSLSADRTETLGKHVEQCSQCERFGSDFELAVQALRSSRSARALPDSVRLRLARALASAQGE